MSTHITKNVCFDAGHAVTIQCDEGRALAIEPGVLTGRLSIKRYEDPADANVVDLTQIDFLFVDCEGRPHLYTLVVRAPWLWPPRTAQVTVVTTPPPWNDAYGMSTIDDAVEYSVCTTDFRPIVGARRATALMWRARIAERVLDVWARFNTSSERATQGVVQITYEIPYGDLLNLDERSGDRATALVDSRVAPIVDVVDALTPSPIRVDAGGRSGPIETRAARRSV